MLQKPYAHCPDCSNFSHLGFTDIREVEAEHGSDFLLKAKNSSDSCDFITAMVLYCRGRKKISAEASILDDKVGRRRVVVEVEVGGCSVSVTRCYWTLCLSHHCIESPSGAAVSRPLGEIKSRSYCLFVLLRSILCCVRDVISMQVCADYMNIWFWLILILNKTYTAAKVCFVLHLACWQPFISSTVKTVVANLTYC